MLQSKALIFRKDPRLLLKNLPIGSVRLPEVSVSSLCLDSRLARPGSLFFAYPGEAVDGRDYIAAAVARGAKVVLFENADGYHVDQAQFPGVLLLGEKKLKHKIGPIAASFYQNKSEGLNLIGVTGTNGKTSVTHFIAQALNANQKTCAVLGTVGNGLLGALQHSAQTTLNPIELQRLLANFAEQGIESVAMEVSSHALDQGRVTGCCFNTAVFTNLSRDHLDYHRDMASYGEAKALLFQQSQLKNAVINQDDAFGAELIKRYKNSLNLLSYSVEAKANLVATAIQVIEQGFVVNLATDWGKAELCCHLYGEFNVSNVLATLAVLLLNNIEFTKALECCAKLQAVAGRMQTFKVNNKPVVVVDYAHTPDALQKALASLRQHCKGKLWCVFGCGGERDKGKRPLMAKTAEQLADCLMITNDNPRQESPEQIVLDILAGLTTAKAQVVLDRAAAIQSTVDQARCGDIVLIAGKGHESYQIVGDQTLKFSDAEQVRRALL